MMNWCGSFCVLEAPDCATCATARCWLWPTQRWYAAPNWSRFSSLISRSRQTASAPSSSGAPRPIRKARVRLRRSRRAMRHVQAWIDAAGITDGPLFRAVLKGDRIGGALHPGDVARCFKLMARRAGLTADETARISGHSTRVGSAQDMLRYGEQLPSIMQAGRWKTAEMVGRYTAKQGARQSAALRIAERRVQF